MTDADDMNIVPDPEQMSLGLTGGEGRRAMALTMAISYYTKTIIPDAEYLREIKRDTNTHVGPVSVTTLISIAHEFDAFLCGEQSSISNIEFAGERIEGRPTPTDGSGGDT